MADKDKQKKESIFRRLAKHLLKNKELSDDEKEVLAATDKYIDDEKENDKPITLKSVLGGDILTTAFFRNQLGLLIVIGICFDPSVGTVKLSRPFFCSVDCTENG